MAKKGEVDRWELMRIIGWGGWYVGERAAELIVYITYLYIVEPIGVERKRGGG